MKDEMKKSGYGAEEEYFYKLNKELIDQKRKALDADRAKQTSAAKQNPHWMHCPKCGESMKEVEMGGLMLDRCSGCKGLYFDNGELELLLSAREPASFFDRLKKTFK